MDGTTIENGSCGYAGGKVWCWVKGFTMPQAAAIFFDPQKTGKIVFEYGQMSDTFEGYTNCINLFIDTDGQISACLIRGEQNV
jgi:hypothetical protein